jgi:hypothetical protein
MGRNIEHGGGRREIRDQPFKPGECAWVLHKAKLNSPREPAVFGFEYRTDGNTGTTEHERGGKEKVLATKLFDLDRPHEPMEGYQRSNTERNPGGNVPPI